MPETFHEVALVREVESPENPGELDKRVALFPEGIARLVSEGVQVSVEAGAGNRMGFKDEEYAERGALIQEAGDIYRGKDLIIKLKGPSMESIPLMRRGTTMLCMFHLGAFPERTEKLREHGINIIAMEGIVDSPREFDPDIVMSKVAINTLFAPRVEAGTIGRLDVRFLGWTHRFSGAIRRAGNRRTKSLDILQARPSRDELDALGPDALYFYDSASFTYQEGTLAYLRDKGCMMLDLKDFERRHVPDLVEKWHKAHPAWEFGFRKIESLQDTGRAGARFGFKLLREVTKKKLKGEHPVAVILGYGNVGMGAIQECHDQGSRVVHVLTRVTTVPGEIEAWLAKADLIVNGAVLPAHDRGKRFLITKKHVAEVMTPGTVLIDLVGGSRDTRGVIENITDNTFLDDPYFIENDIAFSALWGWPTLGLEHESNLRYSRQISDILIGKERLINGLSVLAPGVKPALVIGPYD